MVSAEFYYTLKRIPNTRIPKISDDCAGGETGRKKKQREARRAGRA